MSTYVLTIGGIEKPILLGSLDVQKIANGIDTLTADIASEDGSYRPAMGAEVILTLTSAGSPAPRLFAGYITSPGERGLAAIGDVPIVTGIAAADYNSLASRVHLNETIPVGSLKAALIRVVAALNAAGYVGVTLDPAQAVGPTLPELQYPYGTGSRIDTVLDDLVRLATGAGGSPRTGWTHEIDYFQVLRAVEVGTVAAPFDIAIGAGDPIGDMEVIETRDDTYANRIIVVTAATLQLNRVETTVAGGAIDTISLGATAAGPESFRGYLTVDGIAENIGGSPAQWIWDLAASPQTLTRVAGAVTPGAVISITYDGLFSATVIAEDLVAQAAHGVWEAVETIENIFDATIALTIAEAILAERSQLVKEAHYTIFTDGLEPGQFQQITVAIRNVDEDFLIRSVDLHERDDAPGVLVYEVTAITGPSIQGDYRDLYRKWLEPGIQQASGTMTVTAGETSGEFDLSGSGHPQSVVTANVGRIYRDIDTGFRYRKMAGSGNTGWYYEHIPGAGGGLGPQWTALSASTITSGAPWNDGSGFGAPSVTNMQAPAAFGNTWYAKAVTNTSTGTRGGWESGAFTIPWFDFDFDFTCQVRTHSTFTDGRIFVGLTTATLTNSDTLPGKGLAFRYSDGVDSGWMGVKHDGSTQSLTAQVAAIAVSTNYHLRIRFLRATNTVYFSVNDGAEVSSTANVPAAGTNIAAFMYVYNKNATTQNLMFRHAGMTYPGVAA